MQGREMAKLVKFEEKRSFCPGANPRYDFLIYNYNAGVVAAGAFLYWRKKYCKSALSY
jgi:hypothetical protein